jgi:hypothetical protein
MLIDKWISAIIFLTIIVLHIAGKILEHLFTDAIQIRDLYSISKDVEVFAQLYGQRSRLDGALGHRPRIVHRDIHSSLHSSLHGSLHI